MFKILKACSGAPSSRASFLQRSTVRTFCSPPNDDDSQKTKSASSQDHTAFTTFYTQDIWTVMQNLLTNEKFQTEMYQNVGAVPKMSIFRSFEDVILGSYSLLGLLNPLVKKYGFNPTEFLQGASFAFERVRVSLADKDLYEYAVGHKEPVKRLLVNPIFIPNQPIKVEQPVLKTSSASEEAEFLEDIMSARLYDQVIEAFRTIHKLNIKREMNTPKAIKIHSSKIIGFTTQLVGDETEYDSKTFRYYASMINSLAKKNQSSHHDEYLKDYEKGSLVADVIVRFVFSADVDTQKEGDENVLQEMFNQQPQITMEWGFVGCINNKVPLNWKINTFNDY